MNNLSTMSWREEVIFYVMCRGEKKLYSMSCVMARRSYILCHVSWREEVIFYVMCHGEKKLYSM